MRTDKTKIHVVENGRDNTTHIMLILEWSWQRVKIVYFIPYIKSWQVWLTPGHKKTMRGTIVSKLRLYWTIFIWFYPPNCLFPDGESYIKTKNSYDEHALSVHINTKVCEFDFRVCRSLLNTTLHMYVIKFITN